MGTALCTLPSTSIKHRNLEENSSMAGSESCLSDFYSTYIRKSFLEAVKGFVVAQKGRKSWCVKGHYSQETVRYEHLETRTFLKYCTVNTFSCVITV